MPWLVTGLGNPGERFAGTRHNLGARVVERLAERAGERFRKARFLPVSIAEARHEGERVILARSTRFMNESGPSYAGYARRAGIEPERIVAVHDEIDLGFGALKLKRGGSTAGHRGVDSLARALREPGFYRVRLGVGRPSGNQDPADYVLQPFARGEMEEVDVLVEDAADAVLSLIAEGLERAMDRFNRSGDR